MANAVITIENLSKRYLVGHQSAQRERYTALRDVMMRGVRGFARKAIDLARGREIVQGDEIEEFWALKDVNLEVKEGEVLGIIGRNGAGKTTLLKILSRITEPTSGRITLRGRVGSLLEVGTGFHPELTGRENIYLNGAILGMRRAEVRRRFDEIVTFAEVDKFLDTPVKRYSSGMYVRLAFAIAAHLEPEILIVDEVLAVGDVEFQKKCLGKMQDVAGHGRTVLFVSHNMAAVRALCTQGLLLVQGAIASEGAIETVVKHYMHASNTAYSISFIPDAKRPSISKVSIDRKALLSRNLMVDIAFVSSWPLAVAVGGVTLRTSTGEPIWGSNGRFHPQHEQIKGLTSGVLRCEAQGLPISPGQYHLSVWLADWHEDYDSKIDILSFEVDEDYSGPRPPASTVGFLAWPAVWRTLSTNSPTN